MRLLLLPLLTSLILAGCQTLSTPNTLTSGRTNIAIGNALSQSTKSIVLSSGRDEKECLVKFEDCIKAVDEVFMSDIQKPKFAALAELYYAHALILRNGGHCQFYRKPINPYYANAPIPQDQQNAQTNAIYACQSQYLDNLYNAIRYSYAYLFYNSLTNDDSTQNPYVDGNKSGNNLIVSDIHIKAQDIYHLATARLINEIYLGDKGSFGRAVREKTQDPKNRHLPVQVFTTENQGNTHKLHFYLAQNPSLQAPINEPQPDNIDDTAPQDPENTEELARLEELAKLEELKKIKELEDIKNFETGIQALSDLTSMYDTHLPNLSVTSTRFGVGTGFVGSLNGRHTSTLTTQKTYKSDSSPTERIYPMSHLLLTAVASPDGDTLDKVLNTNTFLVYFYDPYHTKEVQILGENYPLFANFSAGYAKWLEENRFNQVALMNMLDKNNTRLPELYMLEPYNPNKKVIIMLHGLASSPKTWVNLTNSLLADPILRENYQVWQIFYPTNLPMLENRYQIQKLVNATFAENDPENTHKASHNATIISHSMGAVIGRLMLSNDDLSQGVYELVTASNKKDKASTNTANQKALKKLINTQQDIIGERFRLTKLPQVDTAVFISAPFRGTNYADRWFTRTLRHIIRLPVGLTKSVRTTLNNINDGDGTVNLNPIANLYLQNGASQLSDKSEFMQLTKNIAIDPSVRYHLIMANNTGNTADIHSAISEHISDGIVPYESSHLDGAASEIVLDGEHSIHENPKTVLYLRKILHEQLGY